jgi:DNA-binding helix-hairpin-helix protein with protein kinase domain
MEVFDGHGTRLRLGTALGRGGEGAVFAVEGDATRVAKLYHQRPDPELSDKLRSMARLHDPQLLKIATWPIDTVHQKPGGPVTGLLMPRKPAGSEDIHQLYGPRTRLQKFPHAGVPFLLHTATNLARAFAVVHSRGHVVGDVNHSNAVVSPQGTLVLIDCDSFQVRDPMTGRVFLCNVGVSTHQPPEFQAPRSFQGVVRTADHDAFGLAVLLFQLLFLGRHPFAGAYLGPGDMPIERAISERRFAYSSRAKMVQMRPPPGAPPLAAAGPLGALFERAFTGTARPKADEWVRALEAVQQHLRRCARNPEHALLDGLVDCPWCSVEAALGVVLFPVRVAASPAAASGGAFVLEPIWAQIAAVPTPPSPTPLPSPQRLRLRASPRARRIGLVRRTRMVCALMLALAGIVACNGASAASHGEAGWYGLIGLCVAWWLAMAGRKKERLPFETQLNAARIRWNDVQSRWDREAGGGAFVTHRQRLEQARRDYQNLAARRQQQLDQLRATAHQRQLQRFLDQHYVSVAGIRGIGPGRAATLSSFGVETAADVEYTRIISIPGFGPSLTGELLAWRDQVERRFRFDATRAVEPADIAQVDQGISLERAQLERLLRAGPGELRRLAQQAQLRQTTMFAEIDASLREVAQAEADVRALA